MKLVTIRPVEKPKSFNELDFDAAAYAAAAKVGEKLVPYPTALEAVQNGKGLYEIKPESKQVVEIKTEKDLDDMTNDELAREMRMFGRPPRKKMTRAKVIETLQKWREDAANMIVDDDIEDAD